MYDDKQLKQAVLDTLNWQPGINAAHIGVTANAGVVTLTGHVPSYWEKFEAEKATRRVRDVKAVAAEIEVRLPSTVKHGDEEIAVAALGRIKWDSTISTADLKVTVEKGWVTLTGEVDWHYQQDAASRNVRSLWGVVGVSNQITIKKKPSASKIRDDIRVALDRSWLDQANVNVSAQGGKVTLSGTVRSWYERDEASTAAWAAVGTTAVDNELSVI